MTQGPLPDGYVVHLPPPKHAPHRFGASRSVASDAAIGLLEQTERVCAACGVVKVTVHGPDGSAWREWRRIHGGSQFKLLVEPPCEPPFGDAP